MKKLRTGGTFYGFSALQRHFQQQADYFVKSATEVLEVALRKDAMDHQYASNILLNLVSQVLYYHQFKNYLHKDSSWFKKKASHADWLARDISDVSFLKTLGTVDGPTLVPDPYWLEDRVEEQILQALRHFKQKKDADGLIEIISVARYYIQSLSVSWNTKIAIRFYKQIQEEMTEFTSTAFFQMDKTLQLVELVAVISVDIVQQSLQRVVTPSSMDVLERIANNLFIGKQNQNVPNVTPRVMRVAEEISAELSFERKIEHTLRSPEWYVTALLARELGRETKEVYQSLANVFVYSEPSRERLNFESAVAAALMLQRKIEVLKRVISHHSHFHSYVEELKKFEKSKDVKIEPFEDHRFLIELKNKLNGCFEPMADLILQLFRNEHNSNLPDFFGLAYQQLTDEILRQLIDNDYGRFERIFEKVLVAALYARSRIEVKHSKLADQIATHKLSLDPIIDLMDLSGYAILYSEIHGNKSYVDKVLSAWAVVLANIVKAENNNSLLIAAYNLTKSDFRMSPGSSRRYRWGDEFKESLREKRYWSEEYDDEPKINRDHTYLKIYLGGGGPPHYEGAEVFLTFWLLHYKVDETVLKQVNSPFLRQFLWSTRGKSI